MKRKKIGNWAVTIAVIALLLTVGSSTGLMQIATFQARDREQENQKKESKKIKSVLLKTVADTRLGIQYRKEFNLTNTDSKYTLAYSCVGRRCDCRKAEREVEQGIAEEFLRNVETLKDEGERARPHRTWTEINLLYSDLSSRKITIADFNAAVGAKLFNIACGSVASELKASVANLKVPAGLVITYDDMHPLWGGTTIVIRGDGRGERLVGSRKESKAKITHTTINQRQLLEFIQLLIRLKAWEQHTPQRRPRPDESRATLTISINGQASESWEWFNEISTNNRLIQVKAKMLALTK